MLSDELHTVIDEDESDFAELCFLFRMQKRVVQGVAQLLQDRQENSAYLECEEETKDQVTVCGRRRTTTTTTATTTPTCSPRASHNGCGRRPTSEQELCLLQSASLAPRAWWKHLSTLKYPVVDLRYTTCARMRTDSLLKSPFHVKGIALVLCSSYANRIFSRCLLKIKVTFDHFSPSKSYTPVLLTG